MGDENNTSRVLHMTHTEMPAYVQKNEVCKTILTIYHISGINCGILLVVSTCFWLYMNTHSPNVIVVKLQPPTTLVVSSTVSQSTVSLNTYGTDIGVQNIAS